VNNNKERRGNIIMAKTDSGKCDVIIVGAGVGGAVAAAYLAKAGLKTVMFEKTQFAGGYKYSSIDVGGCKTDRWIRLLTYDSRGNAHGHSWNVAAKEVGATLRWQYLENSAVHILGKHKPLEYMVLPNCCSGRAFAEIFSRLIPLSESSFNDFAKLFEQLRDIPDEQIAKMDNVPFTQWMNERTNNEEVKAFFHKLNNTLIVSGSENASVPAIYGVVISMLTGDSNYAFAADGASEEVPKAFVKVATDHGCDLKLNHPVLKVIVENNVAKGVLVKGPDGVEKTYTADRVIVNADLKSLPELMGANMPPDMAAAIKSMSRATEVDINVTFALNKEIWNPMPSQVVVVTPEFDFCFAIIYPDRYVRSLSPPGKQCIICGAFVSAEKYASKTDTEWLNWYRDTLDQVVPGLKAVIAAEDYRTMKSPAFYGLFYGPKVSMQCSTIPNLNFIGDYTDAPGVITEKAAAAGMMVAKKIIGNK
jgi:phytoene dehydrogenase-like protein